MADALKLALANLKIPPDVEVLLNGPGNKQAIFRQALRHDLDVTVVPMWKDGDGVQKSLTTPEMAELYRRRCDHMKGRGVML